MSAQPSDERFEIHDLVEQLCNRLGLESRLVRHLDIYPRRVAATVYEKGKDGNPYVDSESREPVTRQEIFAVNA